MHIIISKAVCVELQNASILFFLKNSSVKLFSFLLLRSANSLVSLEFYLKFIELFALQHCRLTYILVCLASSFCSFNYGCGDVMLTQCHFPHNHSFHQNNFHLAFFLNSDPAIEQI